MPLALGWSHRAGARQPESAVGRALWQRDVSAERSGVSLRLACRAWNRSACVSGQPAWHFTHDFRTSPRPDLARRVGGRFAERRTWVDVVGVAARVDGTANLLNRRGYAGRARHPSRATGGKPWRSRVLFPRRSTRLSTSGSQRTWATTAPGSTTLLSR